MRILNVLPLLILIALPGLLNAQPGANDATFNATDIGFWNGDGPNGTVYSAVVQPDGKILIAGNFTWVNGSLRNCIARLNADGSLDATFNPGTGANIEIRSIVLQPNGRILIGGAFTTYNGTTRNRVARLSSDGSLDATFNPGTGASSTVFAVHLQSDGRVVIGGDFTTYNGTVRNRLARLNANGSLDATFDPGTGVNSAIFGIAGQTDGKVIIQGQFTSYNGTARNAIARVNTDGSLDATFSIGTGPNTSLRSIALQSDGKVIIGGTFTNYNGTARNRIARLNTDGSLDATFNPGTGADNWVLATAVQADGKILIGGEFTTFNGIARSRIARLNSNGSLDTGYGPGAGASDDVFSIALQADSKVLLGGFYNAYNNLPRSFLVRTNTDGTLDAAFIGLGTGANDEVEAIAVQPDGKVLIAGYFTGYGGTVRNRIARLNADGSLDATFNPGSGADAWILSIALQPNGKILIGGAFSTYNGTARGHIARLNSDGSLDATFDPGSGTTSSVYSIALQADGRMLIGGFFTGYNGTARNRIARVNSNGSLDTSFDPGTGTDDLVRAIALQPDGKVVIGGQFTTFNGTARSRIARLNANGSLDTTFDPGTGASGFVQCIALRSDGRMIVGGGFTNYNGTSRNRIARVNADGSLDTGFNIGTGANSTVECLAVQADDRVIMGGSFSQFGSTLLGRIARLNTNGSLDVSFNTSIGANSYVNAVALQPDGKVLVAGDLTSYGGVGRNRVARVLGGGLDVVSVVPTGPFCAGNSLTVDFTTAGTYNAGNTFTAQRSSASGSFSFPVAIGTFIGTASGSISCTLPANTSTGAGYLIRVVSSDPVVTGNANGTGFTISALPSTATVGNAQTICANGTTTGLGGNTPGNGTGAWSVVDGGTGTFAPDDLAPNATFTHTGGAGPITLRWRISNGTCTPSEATVSVTVDQPTLWYADADADGAGDPAVQQLSCAQPVGYVATSNDQCPDDAAKTVPGICGCGVADSDADGDGLYACQGDQCDNDPAKTTPGACGCGIPDTDTDADGTADCMDGCPSDPTKTSPGVCGCDVPDMDTDSDGTADCNDACPSDPAKTTPGACGCGIPDTDTDADGTADCVDACPSDPTKTGPGVCGCGVADVDTDGDGTADCNDACPADPEKIAAGSCGCGNPEPGAACDDGNAGTVNDVITPGCACAGTGTSVQLAVRVFLDGPYDAATGLMNDQLRTLPTFPLTEPFTALGYAHVGGGGESINASVLTTTGNNAVVDWVVLELRDAVTPATMVATRSALVQRDGDVVDTDGGSPVSVTLPPGSYHVAMRHRNHLGAMTAAPVALSGAPAAVDLTSVSTGTYGTNARRSVAGLVPAQVLWAGDVTFDGSVQYTGPGNDRDPILVTVGSTTPNNVVNNTYSTRDVNLNGNVQYTGAGNDRDPILVNVGSTTPNNVRSAQLP